MVEERLTDGKRIAQLLASEIEGHGGTLAGVAVADARPDAEPTTDGAFAYAVERDGDSRIAEVYLQPERARVELLVGRAAAAEAARERDLRVRPKAVEPPRTLLFVEDGAEVKRALGAFEAALASADEREESGTTGDAESGGDGETDDTEATGDAE